MSKMNIVKYIVPVGLLITILIVICFIVTSCNTPPQVEHFNVNSTENLSVDKVLQIVPYIQSFHTSKYPVRKSLTTQDIVIDNVWEDISMNKHDIIFQQTGCWNSSHGFNTNNNVFTTKPISSFNFDKINEWTIIIHIKLFEKDIIEDVVETPIYKEEVISSENASDSEKTILDVGADNVSADNVTENDYPTKKSSDVTRKIKNGVGLSLPLNKGKYTHIKIANGIGSTEMYIDDAYIENIVSSVTEEDDIYLFITYNGNTNELMFYQNETLLVSETIEVVLDTDKPIIINKDSNLSIGLQEIVILNKVLNKKELLYFTRPEIITKAIIEYHSSDIEKVDVYVEKCTTRCTKTSCVDECVNSKKKQCPTIYTGSDGNYLIDNVNYGNVRSIAKQIYKINYPLCNTIPDELEDYYNREVKTLQESPFIVQSELHPMKYNECENTQWGEDVDYDKINNKCKNRIDSYCYENSELDPFCSCWKSSNSELPECRKYRSTFNNPRNRGCASADFSIEEHPDFNKYIRKDKIPCWGCSLD